MRWLLVVAAMLGTACGSDELPIAVVEVDTTQVKPAPDSLFLTLTTMDGDAIAHTSDVAASGLTRVEILASKHTPAQVTLTVAAYAARTLVSQSPPAPLTFEGDDISYVTVAMP